MKHEITVLNAEIIQAKSKRYGLKLKLSFKFPEEIIFYEFFWFGNYKDFQEDSEGKSYLIWKVAIERFNQLKPKEEKFICTFDILNPKTFIGYTFNSEIEVNPDSDSLFLKG